MEGWNFTRVPLPSGFSMSRSKKIKHVEKSKIMLGGEGKFLKDCLRQTLYNFIFTFPESTFHDISLAPHQSSISRLNNLELKSNRTSSEQFLRFLLLTRTLYQLNHLQREGGGGESKFWPFLIVSRAYR